MKINKFINGIIQLNIMLLCLYSVKGYAQNLDSIKKVMYNLPSSAIPEQNKINSDGNGGVSGDKQSLFLLSIYDFKEKSTQSSFSLNDIRLEEIYQCKNILIIIINPKVNRKILDVLNLDSFPEIRELWIGPEINSNQLEKIAASCKHLYGLKIRLISDEIPASICSLPDLTWMEITSLSEVPLRWPLFTKHSDHLKMIKLNNLLYTKTDASLWQIPSLEYLWINADLSSVPVDMNQLNNLRALTFFTDGDLKLPETCSGLESLLSLEIKAGGSVAISDQLKGMKQLKVLRVTTEILSIAPDFKGLNRLKYLEVHANNQKPVRLDLNGLDSLESLYLSGNNFEAQLEFPIGLDKMLQIRELIISKSFIMDIPHYFSDLKKLEVLSLSEYNQLDFDDFKFLAEKTKIRRFRTIHNGRLSEQQRESEVLRKFRFQDEDRYPSYQPRISSAYESYYLHRQKKMSTF